MKTLLALLLLPLAAEAANPCLKAHVPAADRDAFLKKRLLGEGISLVSDKGEDQQWQELVIAARLDEETRDFDLVERHVFLRRLGQYSLKELAKSYPKMDRDKLKRAKAEVHPCT